MSFSRRVSGFFRGLKKGTEHLNYGRPIIADWGARSLLLLHGITGRSEFVVFDAGCGHGDDLTGVQKRLREVGRGEPAFRVRYAGVEGYGPFVEECRTRGIETYDLNIERDYLPFDDATVDIIITNQLLEHTKEIFWIFSEYARVLRPGGRLIVGVPNLASLHNRLLLLLGLHPTAQQSRSAHVRSFTLPDLRRFAESGGFFQFIERRGSNFYPFPPFISRPLAVLFPSFAWGLFALFERTHRSGSFLENLQGEENFLETPFYGGPQHPAPLRAMQTTQPSSVAKRAIPKMKRVRSKKAKAPVKKGRG